jgi:hypothetical protein
MAWPTRNASPGFMLRSRVIPLRLFNIPITASRSAIGVPGSSASRLPLAARSAAFSTLTG